MAIFKMRIVSAGVQTSIDARSTMAKSTPAAGFDPETYARGFLDIWLKSPDHRTNLTYGAFDKTGIGIAVNGDAIYAAELFATDLGLPEPP